MQVAYTINESKKTEDREYRPMIRDNYAKYVVLDKTINYLAKYYGKGWDKAEKMEILMDL
mgnify:CR=1 FL=1